MNSSDAKFALCIENSASEDLEKGKVYQVILDGNAEVEGYLRVVDESGDDYLYPSAYFRISKTCFDDSVFLGALCGLRDQLYLRGFA